MKRIVRAARWLLARLLGRHRCGSCGQPLRQLGEGDLPPAEVRSRRVAGTLGGLLASAYVCDACTRPGDWVLIE